MNNTIKDFYENNSTKCNSLQRWFMWKLFYIFQKYNINRDTKCIELIRELDNRDNIKSILDIWCWKWDLLLEIYKDLPNINYIYWLDIDEKILLEIKNKFEHINIKSNFFYSDLNENIINLDKKLNLITILAVLEHVFDPEKVIKIIYNLLDENWILIVQVPNIVVLQRRISFLFWIRPRTSWDNWWDWWHISYFTKSDLIKLMKDNWFKIKKITWSWIFANLRNWWVSLLSPDIIIVAEKVLK